MRHRFNPWVRKMPWSRKWHPTPVFLLRKFHGQGSLVDYSPWAAESDTTEHSIWTSGKHRHSVHNHIWLVVFNDYILLVPIAVSYYRLQVPFLTLEIELSVPLNIFILDNQFLKVKVKVTQSYLTLCNPMDYNVGLCSPWNFPGKNIGVGCHFLLQGIFLIQGSSLHLLHWQVNSLPLSHLGSPNWDGII